MEVNKLPPEYLPENFDPFITLKDGTIVKARSGYNKVTDELWIWPTEKMAFTDAAIMFSNPSKTDHIRADISASEYEEYDGYMNLKTINTDAAGNLSIRLNKGSERE